MGINHDRLDVAVSYDVDLTRELDGEIYTVFDVGTYTSNVAPMWKNAVGSNLEELDGWLGRPLIDPLSKAINHMRDYVEEYLAMNPDNRWGDVGGAREYLERFLLGCRLHPEATVRVHR